MKIRKLVTIIEEVRADGQRETIRPIRKAAAIAVIENPFAGRYVEDLGPLVTIGEELGALLGKEAVVHPTLGAPFRAAVGGGQAIIPSAKKLGAAGTAIDVPLHYKDAAFVRTHFDAMEVRVLDAPKPSEILVALVVTDGGRPHPRVGGLTKAQAKGDDGLR